MIIVIASRKRGASVSQVTYGRCRIIVVWEVNWAREGHLHFI